MDLSCEISRKRKNLTDVDRPINESEAIDESQNGKRICIPDSLKTPMITELEVPEVELLGALSSEPDPEKYDVSLYDEDYERDMAEGRALLHARAQKQLQSQTYAEVPAQLHAQGQAQLIPPLLTDPCLQMHLFQHTQQTNWYFQQAVAMLWKPAPLMMAMMHPMPMFGIDYMFAPLPSPQLLNHQPLIFPSVGMFNMTYPIPQVPHQNALAAPGTAPAFPHI